MNERKGNHEWPLLGESSTRGTLNPPESIPRSSEPTTSIAATTTTSTGAATTATARHSNNPLNNSVSSTSSRNQSMHTALEPIHSMVDLFDDEEAVIGHPDDTVVPFESFELEESTTMTGGTSWTLRMPWLKTNAPQSTNLSDIDFGDLNSNNPAADSAMGYFGGLMKTDNNINPRPERTAVKASSLSSPPKRQPLAPKQLPPKQHYKPPEQTKPKQAQPKQKQKLYNNQQQHQNQQHRQKQHHLKQQQQHHHHQQDQQQQQHHHQQRQQQESNQQQQQQQEQEQDGQQLQQQEQEQQQRQQQEHQLKNNSKGEITNTEEATQPPGAKKSRAAQDCSPISINRVGSWLSKRPRSSSTLKSRDFDEDSLADFDDSEWTPQDSAYGAAIPICGWIPKKLRQGIEVTLIGLSLLGLIYLVVNTSIEVSESASEHYISNSSSVSGNSDVGLYLDDDMYVEYRKRDDDYYLNRYKYYMADDAIPQDDD